MVSEDMARESIALISTAIGEILEDHASPALSIPNPDHPIQIEGAARARYLTARGAPHLLIDARAIEVLARRCES